MYAIQKVPMTAGNYLRVVAVPTIRILDSASSNCSKIYIPTLSNGTHRYLSQSLTLTGNGITKLVRSDVDQIRITADFPKADLGFDSSFFNFTRIIETKIVAPGSLVELYVGGLQVTIGQV